MNPETFVEAYRRMSKRLASDLENWESFDPEDQEHFSDGLLHLLLQRELVLRALRGSLSALELAGASEPPHAEKSRAAEFEDFISEIGDIDHLVSPLSQNIAEKMHVAAPQLLARPTRLFSLTQAQTRSGGTTVETLQYAA